MEATNENVAFSLEKQNQQSERLLQKAALIAGALRAFRELACDAAQLKTLSLSETGNTK